MNHNHGGGYKPPSGQPSHSGRMPAGNPGPPAHGAPGYNRSVSPNPGGRGGHYPPAPYGRGAPSYSHDRPPTHPPMHGGHPGGNAYPPRPQTDFRGRDNHRGFNPHHGGRGGHHYNQPMEKGPYMHHGGRPNDRGRGGYNRGYNQGGYNRGGYGRGGYNEPPMDRPQSDRYPPRELKPRRNTRWKEPITKQEISSFFAQYASFILSAKEFHKESDKTPGSAPVQQEAAKESQSSTAPAIVPAQVSNTTQATANPAGAGSEEVKQVSASTPNLAAAQTAANDGNTAGSAQPAQSTENANEQ